MTAWHGGKGSGRRPGDQDKIRSNWDNIFGNKEKPKCELCSKGEDEAGYWFWHEKEGRLCDECGIMIRKADATADEV